MKSVWLFIALSVLFRDWNILLGVEPRFLVRDCKELTFLQGHQSLPQNFHPNMLSWKVHETCNQSSQNISRLIVWLVDWLINNLWIFVGGTTNQPKTKKNPMPSVDEIDSCNVQPGSSTKTNGTINEAFFSG